MITSQSRWVRALVAAFTALALSAGVLTATTGTSHASTTFDHGGRVFVDVNGNGYFDFGDAPLAGAVVQVFGRTIDNNGQLTVWNHAGNFTADANGQWGGTFAGDSHYRFLISNYPTGSTLPPAVGGYGSSLTWMDGTPGAEFGALGPFDPSGQLRVNAGFVPSPYSWNTPVWEDLNQNGVQDAGEPGFAGKDLKADLYHWANDDTGVWTARKLATTTVNSDSSFSFTGVPSGGWRSVAPQVPAGYHPLTSLTPFTTTEPAPLRGVWSTSQNLASEKKYNNNTQFDATTRFPLEADYMSAGSYVYRDFNYNGVRDTGETGVSGATVTHTDAGGTARTVTTDASGAFAVRNIKQVFTSKISATVPAGYVASGAQERTTPARLALPKNQASPVDLPGFDFGIRPATHDFTLTLSGAPETTKPGDTLTFTATPSLTSAIGSSKGWSVDIPLPAGSSWAPFPSGTGYTCVGENLVTCTATSDQGSGTAAPITFGYRLNSDYTAATFTTAVSTKPGPGGFLDTNTANDRATRTLAVNRDATPAPGSTTPTAPEPTGAVAFGATVPATTPPGGIPAATQPATPAPSGTVPGATTGPDGVVWGTGSPLKLTKKIKAKKPRTKKDKKAPIAQLIAVFTLTNKGTDPMNDITVNDTQLGVIKCAPTQLQPGATGSCVVPLTAKKPKKGAKKPTVVGGPVTATATHLDTLVGARAGSYAKVNAAGQVRVAKGPRG